MALSCAVKTEEYERFLSGLGPEPDFTREELKQLLIYKFIQDKNPANPDEVVCRGFLQKLEREIRESFDALHDVMIIIGNDFRIQRINKKGLELCAAPEGDIIGSKCYRVLHGLDQPSEDCPLLAAREIGEPVSIEKYEKKWDRHFSITCSPVRDENGSVVKYVDLISDITERKRVDESLKRTGNLFNLLLENTGLFIAMIENTGNCTLFKGSGLVRLGLSNNTAQYSEMYKIMPKLEDALNKAHSGTFITFESKGSHGGKDWLIHNILLPDSCNAGAVIHLGIDCSDIEQARQDARLRQKQLIAAEKLTSLGALVAGIAHEINNPNMFMGMGAENIASFINDIMPVLKSHAARNPEWTVVGRPFVEANEAVGRVMSGMKEGTERISRIIRALKDFARPDHESIHRDVAIHKVIEDTVEILRNKIKHSTSRFSFKPGDDVPCCSGNHQQLEQILMNLLSNACEALTSTDQRITVTTRYVSAINIVRIEVADEGCGISVEHLPQIQKPFFTTKQLSGGLGIGLSITFDLVKSNNGTIHYKSEPGTGTCVVLDLPAVCD